MDDICEHIRIDVRIPDLLVEISVIFSDVNTFLPAKYIGARASCGAAVSVPVKHVHVTAGKIPLAKGILKGCSTQRHDGPFLDPPPSWLWLM